MDSTTRRQQPPRRTFIPHACALAAACLLAALSARPVTLSAQSEVLLKVMDWNIHHGLDTSSANNLSRVASWIVDIGPDVVSLNEVEKKNGYNGNADEPAVLEAALEAATGVPWYGCFAQRTGSATGQGNLLLSRIRLESCDAFTLSDARAAARGTLLVNNTLVTVFSTHIDDASSSVRAAQVNELLGWAAASPAQRILMGDFNASASATELAPLRAAWEDAWAAAVAAGTSVAYAGNTAGNTRNSRIDYVWRFKTATRLTLRSAQVHDTGTVSDHRPISAVYAVGIGATAPLPPSGVKIVR